MNDNINMTITVATIGEFTFPRWMTTFIRQLFAIPTHMTTQEALQVTRATGGRTVLASAVLVVGLAETAT